MLSSGCTFVNRHRYSRSSRGCLYKSPVNCPRCSRELLTRSVAEITVDTCDGGCGGLWFDLGELRRVDEAHESAGEELIDIAVDPAARTEGMAGADERLECPRDGTPMMRRFSSVKRGASVDECPECGGAWLDPGELRTIRSEFATDEERSAAAESYFDDVFGATLAAERAESAEELARAQQFARRFRFITPSYWIPGKQPGGAF